MIVAGYLLTSWLLISGVLILVGMRRADRERSRLEYLDSCRACANCTFREPWCKLDLADKCELHRYTFEN